MLIVGTITSPEEAREMEFAAKCLFFGIRAKYLAEKVKKVM